MRLVLDPTENEHYAQMVTDVKLTESVVEEAALDWLCGNGVLSGLVMAPGETAA